MFSNIGWTEMLVIAVIAVIFVGPKDLPGMLRQFGRFSRKVRGMAGDFQKQVDDALREAELDSVRDSINDVRKLDPRKAIRDQLNPLKADLERDPNAHGEEAPASDSEAPLVFDEAAAPAVAEPVKVDVDAALAKQAEQDAVAAKPKSKPRKKAASKATTASKPAATKATAKPRAPAKKTATRKTAPKKADA